MVSSLDPILIINAVWWVMDSVLAVPVPEQAPNTAVRSCVLPLISPGPGAAAV